MLCIESWHHIYLDVARTLTHKHSNNTATRPISWASTRRFDVSVLVNTTSTIKAKPFSACVRAFECTLYPHHTVCVLCALTERIRTEITIFSARNCSSLLNTVSEKHMICSCALAFLLSDYSSVSESCKVNLARFCLFLTTMEWNIHIHTYKASQSHCKSASVPTTVFIRHIQLIHVVALMQFCDALDYSSRKSCQGYVMIFVCRNEFEQRAPLMWHQHNVIVIYTWHVPKQYACAKRKCAFIDYDLFFVVVVVWVDSTLTAQRVCGDTRTIRIIRLWWMRITFLMMYAQIAV